MKTKRLFKSFLFLIVLFTQITCVNKTNNTSVTSVNNSQQNINYHDVYVLDESGYSFTKLGAACYKGNLKEVKELLRNGACKERCISNEIYEYDILYAAILFRHEDIVEYLINIKEDVNKVYDENGYTLLSLACSIEDKRIALNIAKKLLAADAQVDGTGCIGGDYIIYPISSAVANNNYELVKLLINKSAKVDVKDRDGNSLVDLAKDNTQIEELIVKSLLKEGSKINNLWVGEYQLTVNYGMLDEFSSMAIQYDINISKDSCVFWGMGYQTDRYDLCRAAEKDDELYLLYIKSMSEDNLLIQPIVDTIAVLSVKDNAFFVNSPLIANTDGEYDVKIVIDKLKGTKNR